MSNTVFQIKRSSVPGRVPTSSDIEIGELAINLADKILYSKDGAGTVFGISSEGNTTLETVLLALYDFPTESYGLFSDPNTSEFGENLLVEYDCKTTFPSGSGVLTKDLGGLT